MTIPVRRLAATCILVLTTCALGFAQRGVSPAAAGKPTFGQFVSVGYELLKEGKPWEAYVAALEAAKTDPNRFESYALAALVCHEVGADNDARDFVEKALGLAPAASRPLLRDLSQLINQSLSKTAQPARPPDASRPPAPNLMAMAPPDKELVTWTAIQNSGNSADFQSYLAAYPNGRFAAVATTRIAAIRATAEARAKVAADRAAAVAAAAARAEMARAETVRRAASNRYNVPIYHQHANASWPNCFGRLTITEMGISFRGDADHEVDLRKAAVERISIYDDTYLRFHSAKNWTFVQITEEELAAEKDVTGKLVSTRKGLKRAVGIPRPYTLREVLIEKWDWKPTADGKRLIP